MSFYKEKGIYGGDLFFFKKTSSTIDEMKSIISNIQAQNKPLLSGTSVIAACQTQGRGQQNKPWISDLNAGLYLTMFFHKKDIVEKYLKKETSHMTLALANACAKTIRAEIEKTKTNSEQILPNISIKWPNDILVENKKIGGILAELKNSYLILSCGINIKKQEIAEEIVTNFPITNLQTYLSATDYLPIDFYRALKPQIEKEFLKDEKDILSFVNDNLWKKNEEIIFLNNTMSKEKEVVTIKEIDYSGALLVVSKKTKKPTLKISGHIMQDGF